MLARMLHTKLAAQEAQKKKGEQSSRHPWAESMEAAVYFLNSRRTHAGLLQACCHTHTHTSSLRDAESNAMMARTAFLMVAGRSGSSPSQSTCSSRKRIAPIERDRK